MWISPWNGIRNVIHSIFPTDVPVECNCCSSSSLQYFKCRYFFALSYESVCKSCDIFHTQSCLVHVKAPKMRLPNVNPEKTLELLAHSRTEQKPKTIFCRNWEHTTCAINSVTTNTHIISCDDMENDVPKKKMETRYFVIWKHSLSWVNIDVDVL